MNPPTKSLIEEASQDVVSRVRSDPGTFIGVSISPDKKSIIIGLRVPPMYKNFKVEAVVLPWPF